MRLTALLICTLQQILDMFASAEDVTVRPFAHVYDSSLIPRADLGLAHGAGTPSTDNQIRTDRTEEYRNEGTFCG